ncbi:MAG: hypothetical protein EHM41_19645 [Chloroflexi bacterium]|nr:MAG: hypothetical protein EHM41_19645 [Chloroflexota bacterium]
MEGLTGPKIDNWIHLIEDHLQQRSGMGLQDVYKLLYQGILGPEHIIDSADHVTAHLRSEWENLLKGPVESLVEPIHPDGTLARINLRPFRASGGSLDQLTEACLDASRHSFQGVKDLQAVWSRLARYFIENHLYGFTNQDVQNYTRWLQENDFPTVHHSENYRQIYRPAYRLVFMAQ